MKSADERFPVMQHDTKSGHGRLWLVSIALVFAGATAFMMGVLGSEPTRAWQAYLVNFVFWTGLAFGTVLLSAILTMTNAKWGRPIKRLAEAPCSFLPVSVLLFAVLFLGKETIFPWIHHPSHHNQAWLTPGFLFLRNGIGLLLLTGVSIAMTYHSVKRDLKTLSGPAPRNPSADDSHGRALAFLSPVFTFLYAVVLTLIAIDLIMSLDPGWVSTLFGAYYFIGSFYTGLAAVTILAAIAVKSMGLRHFILPKQFHDLGKLLLAFCIVTGDFFYVQFLVIWYGNLPEETRYVILRVRETPWESLAWAVLLVCFVLPFVVLLLRRIKLKPALMMSLSVLILIGMWLERFLLVAPSLWQGKQMPLGPTELLITAGFLGVMAMCLLGFFQRFPPLPVGDPLFQDFLEGMGQEK